MSNKPTSAAVPASVTDPIAALIRPLLKPGYAAVVVTHYTRPLHVMIVASADVERTWRTTATFLNENGYGPEYDVITGVCESTTPN